MLCVYVVSCLLLVIAIYTAAVQIDCSWDKCVIGTKAVCVVAVGILVDISQISNKFTFDCLLLNSGRVLRSC